MLLAAVLCLFGSATSQSHIYVAPHGSDAGLGTEDKPKATFEAAIEQARRLKCHSILVMPGRFHLTRTISLEAIDSGLTIQAARSEHPVLIGGIEPPASKIRKCDDQAVLARIINPSVRDKVNVIDLAECGVAEVAPIAPRGFPNPARPAPNELFRDFNPYVCARWPNTGYAKVGKVLEAGNGETDRDKPKRQPVFEAGERAKLWAHADDLWMYGYWKYDWADESIKVKQVDSATGSVTLAAPHVYGVAAGSPYFAENLLEELDQPGEFFLDRTTLKMYFIDRENVSKPSGFQISTLSAPMISIKGGKDITVKGLDFRVSRGDGASIQGCGHVMLENCAFESLGERAAVIEDSSSCGLIGCSISRTGEGGVVLAGGDRNTLVPAKNYVDNCEIQDYERRSQTYRPAVLLSGVGNRVSHCLIHDAPHSAIIFSGNDHVIEFNEFHHTISLTGDGGVIYTGRDWTARGTVIRYNHFHDNVGIKKWEPAIYIDDLGSGIKVVGNLIERCHWGFLIGGGRDNVVEKNALVDCDLAFDCDARGLGWAASSRPTMMERLKAVPYESPIWRTKYPALPNILGLNPMAPSGNVLRNNVLIRSGKLEDRMEAGFKKTVEIEGNIVGGAEALIDATLGVPVFKMGLIGKSQFR